MNTRKTISTLLLLVGIAVLIVFALADVIGIGDKIGFGRVQIGGMIVGAVVAIIGLFLLRKKSPA